MNSPLINCSYIDNNGNKTAVLWPLPLHSVEKTANNYNNNAHMANSLVSEFIHIFQTNLNKQIQERKEEFSS